jgi:DNA-cytosine methyltransferase
MKILSLFDGMSVAQQALRDSGIEIEEYYASEIDPYAIAVTQNNHPRTIQLGSVTDLKYGLLDSIHKNRITVDLMIGGSPCQDLSIAKANRKGLDGARSGLFWEYVRILNEVKPKYFILENVNSMPKEAKAIITEALGVEPIMINASLVSAQNRKRLFWVGKWNGEKYEQVEIEQPEDRGIILKDILEDGTADRLKSYCIDASYYKGANWKQYKESGRRQLIKVGELNSGGQGDRIYSTEGKSVNLSANGGGRGAKTGLYAVGVASRTYPRVSTGKPRTKQIEIRKDGKANSMTSVQGDSMVMTDSVVRKLTPIECLRLQSMPDTYFDNATHKGKPISNTQRYKMCGNAFNKEVIAHILKHLV